MRSKADVTQSPNVAAVIVCAGRGERSGLAYNKIFYHIGKKTVLETVLDNVFLSCIKRAVVVAAGSDISVARELCAAYPAVTVCEGGATRFESVFNGLNAVGNCDIVVIHDGARPFAAPQLFDSAVTSALDHGSGIAAVPTVDTIKRVDDEKITQSIKREGLYNIQTPQAFKYSDILKAYNAVKNDQTVTDDSEVYARAGFVPVVVQGSYDNKKLTTPRDFTGGNDNGRVGVGFDVHRLVSGRKLILGGVQIPYEKGLDGHSDADVLTHAIMDAMLSAAGLPDIGVLFPDSDPSLLGISSLVLLDNVKQRVEDADYKIVNISAVVMAQAPKLAPHIQHIRQSLADRLCVNSADINVSATTTELLGIIGNGDGIAASASCILEGAC